MESQGTCIKGPRSCKNQIKLHYCWDQVNLLHTFAWIVTSPAAVNSCECREMDRLMERGDLETCLRFQIHVTLLSFWVDPVCSRLAVLAAHEWNEAALVLRSCWHTHTRAHTCTHSSISRCIHIFPGINQPVQSIDHEIPAKIVTT